MKFHVIKPEEETIAGGREEVGNTAELCQGNSCYMESSHGGECFPVNFRVSK